MSFLVVISALGVAAFALYTVYQQNQNSGDTSGAAGATPSPSATGVPQAPAPLPSVSGGSGNYYSSDGSITGSSITNDPATWPAATISDKMWTICAAVASAEGYDRGAGTAPYDMNNPGDLSPGDEAGEKTCGPAEQHGGSAIIHFCTAEAGWRALYHKFSRIVAGQSTVYPIYFSWEDISKKYAGNSGAWLANVVGFLGVDANTTPAGYYNTP